jgi:hypothetical protein
MILHPGGFFRRVIKKKKGLEINKNNNITKKEKML